MTSFLQIHFLTTYPPSNPNRDDLGRPKTAMIGGRMRQRISSQALKRAIRTSPDFSNALQGHLGDRTQRLGEIVLNHLLSRNVEDSKARGIAREVSAAFGKLEDKKNKDGTDPVHIKQLAFISPDEKKLALDLTEKLLAGEKLPKEKELSKLLLRKADGAVDIAMFGRMLAYVPECNRDAAVQVAHAFTTNAVEIEDDFYTAVDDLKKNEEDAGAGFVGEAGFGAGVYYLYICVNRDLLVRNLDGDHALAQRGLEALVRAAAVSSPGGKQNSFANRVKAEFILVEKGDAQPRSLASAFTKPVTEPDQMEASVNRLLQQRAAFAAAYGQDWTAEKILRVGDPQTASLNDVALFAGEGLA